MRVAGTMKALCICLIACALQGCTVYDEALVHGQHTDAGPVCTPMPELCNGMDDDCDDKVDEDGDEIRAECSAKILHGTAACSDGLCVWLRMCDPGYFNCDGKPENGCESDCPCTACGDAGSSDEDAGDMDAG